MTNRPRNSVRLLIALQFFFVVISFAQNTDSQRIFGAVTSSVATLRNTSAVLVGGQGGWMPDPSFAVGIEGYTLVSNVPSRVVDTLGNHDLTLSYGGATLDYVVPLGQSFYAVFHALVGGGSISHKEGPYIDRRQYHDPFVVVEPRVTVETAISKIFRIGVGVSYRQVAWLNSSLATQSDLSGVSGSLTLEVGFF